MSDLKWIKHDGGPMPVPGDTSVSIRVKSGRSGFAQGAPAVFYEKVNNWWDGSGIETITEYAIVEPRNPAPDNINSPIHYGAGSGIECIDAIRAALTPEEFRGYCKGNMLKYVWRERSKGGDESLQKAAKYAEFALEKADA